MEIRKQRIRFWGICVIIAITLMGLGEWTYTAFVKEKSPITVCAPADMKKAFKAVLKDADLHKEYTIVITDNPNANICVSYNKENDATYQEIAFSPFVIGYSAEEGYFKKLKKAEVLLPSEYNPQEYDLDFLTVMEEVIGEAKWENFGIRDLENIHVFYPAETTPYWNDFYDFMLVTANHGTYPENEEQWQKATALVEQFLESDATQAVEDIDEKMVRTGGFTNNVFWVFPEHIVAQLSQEHGSYARVLYPMATVNIHYYMRYDETANPLFLTENKDFYEQLYYKKYRSHFVEEIYVTGTEYVCGLRDTYQVVKVPTP